jgi:hypothetical protein
MQRSARTLLLAAVLTLLLASPASALLTYHTSVASFEAAAGAPSTVIDDYSDWVGPGLQNIGSPAFRTGYTVSNPGDFWDYNLSGPTVFPDGALRMFMFGSHFFTFDDPIIAMGFDAVQNFGVASFEVNGEFAAMSGGCCGGTDFNGVVFDPPQTEVIVFLNSFPLDYDIDNLRTVPGPGQIGSLVAGIAAVALLSVRRRNNR